MDFEKENSGQHLSILSIKLNAVDAQVFRDFKRRAEIFFDSSDQNKLNYKVSGGAWNFRGYFQYKSQNYDVLGKRKDLKEGFDFGKHSMDRDYNHFYGKNICPPELNNFESTYSVFENIASRFVSELERKLTLQKGQLSSYFSPAIANLRLLHYPAREESNSTQIHLVEHFDPGFLTLIYSDKVATEYLCPTENVWREVPTQEDRLCLIFGTTAQRWSEGLIQAPLHRISHLDSARTSLCFFYNPGFFKQITSINQKDSFSAGRFIYCESVEGPHLHEEIYQEILSHRIN